jgi:hypothetical protein
MKKGILILMGILILSISFAEVINLNKVVLSNIYFGCVNVPLNSKAPSNLVNLPNLENSLYGKISLNNENFYLVLGEKNNNVLLYIDKNGDNSFSPSESVYLNKEGNTLFSLPIKFNLNYSGKVYPYFLKFYASKKYVSRDTLGQYQICYTSDFYRVGNMKVNGKEYKVEIFNFLPNGQFGSVKNDMIVIESVSNKSSRFYSYKDSEIQIGENIYKVLSVSESGDSMELQKVSQSNVPFDFGVGDKITNLKFKNIQGKTESLSDLKNAYTLIFTYNINFANDEGGKNAFVSNINSLSKEFSNKLNLVGVFVPIVTDTDASTNFEYENMNLGFYMNQNGWTFDQLDYQSSIKLAKELNIASPNQIILLGKDSTVIYKSGFNWVDGNLSETNLTFKQLKSLLLSLIQD